MRIQIVSDAWTPQINGVVTTLAQTVRQIESECHEIAIIEPGQFATVPAPSYPEIRLAVTPFGIGGRIRAFQPDAIHIATEGPLGLAARLFCGRNKIPFTTSYHTDFPAYLNLRWRVPVEWTYRYLRWFHGRAETIMVNSPGVHDALRRRGFTKLALWTRGVDSALFYRLPSQRLTGGAPVYITVGRIALEKNLDAFCRMKTLGGPKIVVGDGPERVRLERSFPDVRFTGYKMGRELVAALSAADLFVFPSKTDTFGLVIIEALACGLPVVAYDLPGPRDIIVHGRTGMLVPVDGDLEKAARDCALSADSMRQACRNAAEGFSWSYATRQFLGNLCPRAGRAMNGPGWRPARTSTM